MTTCDVRVPHTIPLCLYFICSLFKSVTWNVFTNSDDSEFVKTVAVAMDRVGCSSYGLT